MPRKITTRLIEGLRCTTAHRIEITDAQVSGLAFRVSPDGVRSWTLRYLWQGKPVRLVLGHYEGDGRGLDLDGARGLASRLKQALREGRDPRAMLAPPPPPSGPPVVTLRDAVERWARDRGAAGSRSVKERKRTLEIHALPRLGDRPLVSLTRADFMLLLEDLRDGGGLSAQVNRVQVLLGGVLSYALDRGLIESHPLAGAKPVVNESATRRSAVLTLQHLAKVWRAAEGWNSTAACIVRLLLLVPARREEATGARWDEIEELERDNPVWRLPAARMKGNRDLPRPLPPTAATLLRNLPQRGDFIFAAAAGRGAFRGWKRAAALLRARANLTDAKGKQIDWTIHDLRRSVATAMAEHLAISSDLIGRLLGHSPKSIMGITAVYDRAERLDELRRAMERWDALLMTAVEADVADPNHTAGLASILERRGQAVRGIALA